MSGSERTRWVPRCRLDAYEVLRTGRLGGLGCGSDRAAVEGVLGPPQAVGRRMKGYALLKYGHVNQPSALLENGLKVQWDAPAGVWSMSMTCPA